MRHSSQNEPLSMTSADFTPLGSHFLGKYIMETESEGGILMPEQDTWWARVVRVGPDCTVEVGERVLMSMYRGDNVDMADGKFTIFNEKDALCAEGV